MWSQKMALSKDVIAFDKDAISFAIKELARQFRYDRAVDDGLTPENTTFGAMVKRDMNLFDGPEGYTYILARVGRSDTPGPSPDDFYSRLFAVEAWKPRIKRPDELVAEYEVATGESFDPRP